MLSIFSICPVNRKYVGGYVIEILIITPHVLRNVVPNLVLKFMSKFTTFVGSLHWKCTNYETTFRNFGLRIHKRLEEQPETESKCVRNCKVFVLFTNTRTC